VDIKVVTDRGHLKPRAKRTSPFPIQNAEHCPPAASPIFEARGTSLGARRHGIGRISPQCSGVASGHPPGAPHGKLIAYWSERSGEYELTVPSR